MANSQPGDTAAAGLLALNRAESVAEAGLAAAAITSPVQNLLVADRQTHRAVRHRTGADSPGRRRCRAGVRGRMAATTGPAGPAATQLPQSVSPASGRLVNANEPVAPPDFPVFLGRDGSTTPGARRIREMLDRDRASPPAGFAADADRYRQTCSRATCCRRLRAVPAAGRAAAPGAGAAGGLGRSGRDGLSATADFQRLDAAVLPRPCCARANLPPGAGRRPHWPMLVIGAVARPVAHWCGGDCGPLLREALAAAVAALAARFGADPVGLALGGGASGGVRQPAAAGHPGCWGAGRGPHRAPGDDDTLFAAAWRPGRSSRCMARLFAASMTWLTWTAACSW